jgi:predicted transglutaminase-like cysteine proteinase
MRGFYGWVAVATVAILGVNAAEAGFVGLPRLLRANVEHIAFKAPILPPMAFVQFCLRYSDQCRPQRIVFRGGPVRLNAERWQDLLEVNKIVNASIEPERNLEGLGAEKWLIGPARGDCNDYAVTKRFKLIERGWPVRSLLLSEVVTPEGEHHLILVARTSAGDLVLDNLSGTVKPWSIVPYHWVRIQATSNPNYWASIAESRA